MRGDGRRLAQAIALGAPGLCGHHAGVDAEAALERPLLIGHAPHARGVQADPDDVRIPGIAQRLETVERETPRLPATASIVQPSS